jgi:hypothetical protein
MMAMKFRQNLVDERFFRPLNLEKDIFIVFAIAR